MSNLLALFANNLLPILLVVASGYLARKWLQLEARSISRVVFYLFSPCLIFDLLTASPLNRTDLFQMAVFTTVAILSTGAIAWVLGRILRLRRTMLAAVLLCALALNAGNYGLSLNLFAFGQESLAYASLFFVISAIITYTLGVLVASMGRQSLGQSLKGLTKIPTIYSVVLAGLFLYTGWQLPMPLQRAVGLLSDAAIPGMLVVLGLQLQHNHHSQNLPALSLVSGVRLILGPVLGFLFAGLIGMQGMAFNVGVLQSAMPSAVLSTVLATEYDIEPAFVTRAVFISTLLSPLTLTPLLQILGA